MRGKAVVMVVVAMWLGGCSSADAPGEDASGTPATASAEPSASASHSAAPRPSPSALPTLATPTAPPTAPTDATPTDVVAGRVTAITDGCVEVTTDDAVVWSLTGDMAITVRVGDTVTAKVEALADGAETCGPGRGAALGSTEVVR